MDKKELIRRNAIKVIAAEGYYNTTVKMIAQEAQIAVGTIYNYFTNKKEILNYIFAVEFDKRIRLLKNVQEKGVTFKEALTCFLREHFKLLETNSDTTTVLVQESRLPRKHSLEAIDNFMTELPNLLAEMIEIAQKRGEIREVDSKLIANAIFHAIRGVAIEVESKEGEYDFHVAQKELFNFIWIGLVQE